MNLQESAIIKLKDLLLEESNPNLKFRVFVQGGGCSGMQYGFTFDEEQNEDDFDFKFDNLTVVVDATSMQYLQGATIRSFVIDNPNAETSCGCGSSFNPK